MPFCLCVALFLSPALIIQNGYATGTLDIYVLLLVVANGLFVRSTQLFSLLVIAGVFLHELYVFTLPAQVIALVVRRQPESCNFFEVLRAARLPLLACTVSVTLLTVFGRTNLDQASFESVMAASMPAGPPPTTRIFLGFSLGSTCVQCSNPVTGFTAQRR